MPHTAAAPTALVMPARHGGRRGAGPATTGAAVLALQASAGNRAIAGLLAQRLVDGGGRPVPPGPIVPAAHPGFLAVRAAVAGARSTARRHPTSSAAAAAAKRAVEPPADEAEAQAKRARAGTIGEAPTPGFDKAAFVKAVSEAIARQAPKNLDEAAGFADSGKADTVAADVRGRVGQGRESSTRPLAAATERAPDTGAARVEPGTPLPAPAPAPTASLGAARAAPDRAPAEQTDLSTGPASIDEQLAAAEVTPDQLREGNEPAFDDALGARGQAAEHAASAPATVRTKEAGILSGARAQTATAGAAGATAIAGARTGAAARRQTAQQKAKAAEEAARAKVNGDLRGIFDETKTAVTGILTAIDGEVHAKFRDGESAARTSFTQFHKKQMDDFTEREYSGVTGAARWLRDKFTTNQEVERIFAASKKHYVDAMTGVISGVADLVGTRLTDAKLRIAQGRAKMAAYVEGLKPSLRAVGTTAASELGGQFTELEQSVDEKSSALIDSIAEKYVAARGEVDAEITKMQEENKGLLERAKDAVGGAISTVIEFKAMLQNVLSRAAGAIGAIIAAPIRFLGNLVAAVKGGVVLFGANIATHLKAGLHQWLFGALADGGIELPERFDLKGVFQLVLSILGLTWAKVRARIAAKLPPGAMDAVERGFGIVKTMMTLGVAGIWQALLDKIGEIKEMVMTQVTQMVSVEIIKAGIVWLVSLLNPASAFVKACKMIYDIVMFFVEKAAQIKAFVDSILDSIESIVAGGAGAVAGYIEKTLARMVPVVIGFMASLLGLGGISQKIRGILEKIQAPVEQAIDWVVGKAVVFGKKALALGKKLWSKAKGLGKKALAGVKKKLGIAKQGVAAGWTSLRRRILQLVGRKRTFPMRESTHQLWAVGRGNLLVVMIASTPGTLLSRISRAMKEPAVRTNQGLQSRLGRIADDVRRAERRFEDLRASGDSAAVDRQAQSEFSAAMDAIESRLIAVGSEWDIEPLRGGTYVLDGKVHPNFAGKIRRTFYPGGGYKAHLPGKLQDARQARVLHQQPSQIRPDEFWCAGVPGTRPPHASRIKAYNVTLDHKTSVAQHWQHGENGAPAGRNTTQDNRVTWDANPANLEVLCRTCNSARNSGGARFVLDVGEDFRGPGGKR